jgi:hypothetical protein
MFLEPFIILTNLSRSDKNKHVITYNHQNQEYIFYFYDDDAKTLEDDIKSKNFANRASVIYYFKTVELLQIYLGELESTHNYNIEFCVQNGVVLFHSEITDSNITQKFKNYISLLLTTIDYRL